MKRCPSCGYTEEDAKLHLDHYLCKNSGNAPWEKNPRRTLSRLLGSRKAVLDPADIGAPMLKEEDSTQVT